MREKVTERESLGKKENPEDDSNSINPKVFPNSIKSSPSVNSATFSFKSFRKAATIPFLVFIQCLILGVGCSFAGDYLSPNQLQLQYCGYDIAKSFQTPLITYNHTNFLCF